MANEDRKAKTMELSGNEYAKVAERLKLFRTDWPRSKTESAYEYDVDKTVVFTVWLWKDKTEYLEVLRDLKDSTMARGSADANGTAKGEPTGKKDFEKLETIALGRALAMMGYLASGEIASFEEQKEFEKYREEQANQEIQKAVKLIEGAKTNDQLNDIIKSISHVLKFQPVINAGKKRRDELASGKPAAPAVTPPPATTPATPQPGARPGTTTQAVDAISESSDTHKTSAPTQPKKLPKKQRSLLDEQR